MRDLFDESKDPFNLNIISHKGKVVLQNQIWKKINNTAEFLSLIQCSSRKRIFANNGHHEHSSRSHHVFQIKITGQNKAFISVESLLNIVDLAGSERRIDNYAGINTAPEVNAAAVGNSK